MTTTVSVASKKAKAVVNPYLKRNNAAATKQGKPGVKEETKPIPTASTSTAKKNKAKNNEPAQQESKEKTLGGKNLEKETKKDIGQYGANMSQTKNPTGTANKDTGIGNLSSSLRQPKSLKAKLKKEIEGIKRAALLEKQQKKLRKEQRQLEKQRKEQERLRAIDEEKRRKENLLQEEQRRRLHAEQQKVLRERQQLEQERQKRQKEEQQRQLQLAQERHRQQLLQRQILLQQQQQQQQLASFWPGGSFFAGHQVTNNDILSFRQHQMQMRQPQTFCDRGIVLSQGAQQPTQPGCLWNGNHTTGQLTNTLQQHAMSNPVPLQTVNPTPVSGNPQQTATTGHWNSGTSPNSAFPEKTNPHQDGSEASFSSSLEAIKCHTSRQEVNTSASSFKKEQSGRVDENGGENVKCKNVALITPAVCRSSNAVKLKSEVNLKEGTNSNEIKASANSPNTTQASSARQSSADLITPCKNQGETKSTDSLSERRSENAVEGHAEHNVNVRASSQPTENAKTTAGLLCSGAKPGSIDKTSFQEKFRPSCETSEALLVADDRQAPLKASSFSEGHVQQAWWATPGTHCPSVHVHNDRLHSSQPWHQDPPRQWESPLTHVPKIAWNDYSAYHANQALAYWRSTSGQGMQPITPTLTYGYHHYPHASYQPYRSQAHPTAQCRSKPKKEPAPSRLAPNPVDHPSPYHQTHTTLTQVFVIVKEEGKNFGINLQERQKSALVEPEWLSTQERPLAGIRLPPADPPKPLLSPATEPSIVVPSEGSSASSEKPRRKRRKRVFFAVLAIVDAPSATLLQPGDIILSINGVSAGGRTFREACALFSKGCSEKVENGAKFLSCNLTIARQKPPPNRLDMAPALPPIQTTQSSIMSPPAVAADETVAMNSSPLTLDDLNAFANCMMCVYFDPMRMLGKSVDDKFLEGYIKLSPKLDKRELHTLQEPWRRLELKLRKELSARAARFWEKEWRSKDSSARLTDAQIARYRANPRPVRGCRCGSKDHEYLYECCPLYDDLRRLSGYQPEILVKEKKPKKSMALNAVETAFCARVDRISSDQNAEKEERKFVAKMHHYQINVQQKACLAPTLTAMILTGVLELQSDFKSVELQTNPAICDEEDDIPLASLQMESSNKKLKRSEEFNKVFLTKLLLLISSRWGHLYQEPATEEFAWHWEIFHGHHSSCEEWSANNASPRQEGLLTFENIRFLLDDRFMDSLGHGKEESIIQNENLSTQVVLALLLSPEFTGIADEVCALTRAGILSSKNGIPRLTKDWYNRVSLELLNEMQDCSPEHMIHERIGRKLQEKWSLRQDGWALKDDPTVVFDFDEWNEWRDTFYAKTEAQSNNVHGIGRFGL